MPRYFRRIIKVQATDSPNVQLALEQRRNNLPITGDTVIPGLITWDLYQKRLATWDKVRICVGINGEFYEGAEVKLCPPVWLQRAVDFSKERRVKYHTRKYMGIDPAEGGDKSSWCIGDKEGVYELISLQTPDTTYVTSETLRLARKWNIDPSDCHIDRGGGGKEHADRLRLQNFPINTVSFGESLIPDPHLVRDTISEKVDNKEDRYAFKNRRAQMYWMIRDKLNPVNQGFSIPDTDEIYLELIRQLGIIPLTYDEEGRMYLLPKHNKDPNSDKPSLTKLIGHSPDEADALALMVYGVEKEEQIREIIII